MDQNLALRLSTPNRHKQRLQHDDCLAADQILEALKGSNVKPRKIQIERPVVM